MRDGPRVLINFERIEAVPAHVLSGRDNASARALARAEWVLRRKQDGRYLAVVQQGRAVALLPAALQKALPRSSWPEVMRRLSGIGGRWEPELLPPLLLEEMLGRLGLSISTGEQRGLSLLAEPACLTLAGFDRYDRPLWLTSAAALSWQRMRAAAAREGVVLEAISGYRSHAYQFGIFQRKLARGQKIEEILAVNAAPGYSEHHSGRALDIGTPGEAPAEESFEATPAFVWLSKRGADFGFKMSYPRDNPHGIVYEPWHWCLKR